MMWVWKSEEVTIVDQKKAQEKSQQNCWLNRFLGLRQYVRGENSA